MADNYIYSRTTTGQSFGFDGGRSIEILGTSNNRSKGLATVKGWATGVSNEELKLLRTHPMFRSLVDEGWYIIEEGKAKKDADEVIDKAGKKKADKAAQLTEADLKATDKVYQG